MTKLPYIIVGDGNEKPIQALRVELDFHNRCSYREAMDYQEIVDTYAYLVLGGRNEKVLLIQDGKVIDPSFEDILKAKLAERGIIVGFKA